MLGCKIMLKAYCSAQSPPLSWGKHECQRACENRAATTAALDATRNEKNGEGYHWQGQDLYENFQQEEEWV